VLLSAKQTLLNQLHAVERRLEPYRHRIPTPRGQPRRPAALHLVVRQCGALLSRTERDSEQKWAARRSGRPLGEAGSAAGARAYVPPAAGGHGWICPKGNSGVKPPPCSRLVAAGGSPGRSAHVAGGVAGGDDRLRALSRCDARCAVTGTGGEKPRVGP
jgi:hypothetical protein